MFVPSAGHTLYLPSKIADVDVMCLIDSGATLSVVHPSMVVRMQGLHTLNMEEHVGNLRMAGGNNIDIQGKQILGVHSHNLANISIGIKTFFYGI